MAELILTDVSRTDSSEMLSEAACNLPIACSAIPRCFAVPDVSQDEIVKLRGDTWA
jgi:hypothetical protein